MNQGLMGAFAGLGQGITETAQMSMKDHLERKRMELQARIRGEERAESQAFQKSMKAEDREFQQGLLAEEREYKENNRPVYEDVRDDQGSLIGQRETQSNKFAPLSQKTPKNELDVRIKARLDLIKDKMKAIRGKDIQDPGDEQILRDLEASYNTLLAAGSGAGQTLEERLAEANAASGGSADPASDVGDETAPTIESETRDGLISREQKKAEAEAKKEFQSTLDQADEAINNLQIAASFDPFGSTVGNRQPSQEAIKKGEALAQKLLSMDRDKMTETQRKFVAEKLQELIEAGVPVNLDPKQ